MTRQPSTDDQLEKYRAKLRERLSTLTPIFANAAIGDFSKDVEIPESDDELAEVFCGVQVMLEVIRDQMDRLQMKLDLRANREYKLAREKALDEAILESIGEGIIVTDREGTILMLNKSAESMLRCSEKEYVGRRWTDVIGAVDEFGQSLSLKNRSIAVTLAAGRKTHGSYYYVRKDGTIFPVNITAAPIIFDGKVVGAISVFRDITKEKEIERAKNEFVALASHQLRTPQTAIKWYSEMLLSGDIGELDPTQKQFLQEIYDGNQRMVDLVNALLNVSKIELGQLAHEPQEIDAIELVENVVGEVIPMTTRCEQEIFKTYDTQPLPMIADPRQLRMVLQNLLSNASKYTPQGGKITVGAQRQNNSLLFSVSDTGYGIPKDQQSKVFSKFFRGTNVLSKDTDGSGLGLYIVKAVVDQSGGKIWFKSEEGRGTTFYVQIPLRQVPRRIPHQAMARSPATAPS